MHDQGCDIFCNRDVLPPDELPVNFTFQNSLLLMREGRVPLADTGLALLVLELEYVTRRNQDASAYCRLTFPLTPPLNSYLFPPTHL
eukprot:1353288-Amorphochlora_amoeboformis.AAC.2